MGLIRKVLLCFCLLLVLGFGSGFSATAQTWAEWFSQKKTQKKYLLEQIAALQVYLEFARKGYAVVGDGIGLVRDISRGEFSLHEAFISGLAKVSPVVRNDFRVAEIVLLQAGILKAFNGIKGQDLLSADQLVYVAEVASGVINDCYADLAELLLVVTSGKLEMSDAERLDRLDQIYLRMLDRSGFSRWFCGDASLLLRQKKMEQQTLKNLRRYYGID
jgi:hypothetical protein